MVVFTFYMFLNYKPQADHRNAGQKWTVNVQLLQYQSIVGVFFI